MLPLYGRVFFCAPFRGEEGRIAELFRASFLLYFFFQKGEALRRALARLEDRRKRLVSPKATLFLR